MKRLRINNHLAAVAKWQRKNAKKVHQYHISWRQRNPVVYILQIARGRAKRKGLEFSLTKSDICIPEVCPILGVKILFKHQQGYTRSVAPSLDRIDTTKGYIKGNVRVISDRANRCKSNLTLQQIENLYKYSKGEI